VPLDIALLTFSDDPAENKKQAIHVIDCEISSCLYLERFEFIQKYLLLQLWKEQPVTEVRQAWASHKAKVTEQ